MRYLLREYGDSLTGIRDWTSRDTAKEERGWYFHLWHCTRVYEPTLVKVLAAADQEQRHEAIELLDRASRYGALSDYPAMLAALTGAEMSQPNVAQRVAEIRSRFDLWEAAKSSRQ